MTFYSQVCHRHSRITKEAEQIVPLLLVLFVWFYVFLLFICPAWNNFVCRWDIFVGGYKHFQRLPVLMLGYDRTSDLCLILQFWVVTLQTDVEF